MGSSRWYGALVLCGAYTLAACTGNGGGVLALDAGLDAGLDDAPLDAGRFADDLDAASERDAGADADTEAPWGESFSAIYTDIFSLHGCSDCHTADNQHSFLDLSSRDGAYAGLVGRAAAGSDCNRQSALRVEPGNAQGSLLIWKLEGEDPLGDPVCGVRMPFARPPLAPSDIERVRVWIDQGALDN